ncbi:MAG: hypothetical protein WCA13_19720 [Terriglobales bacterium]
MTATARFLAFLLGLLLAATVASGQASNPPALRLLLNEVQPGSLSTEQYCTLVFTDRHFHMEKATLQHGRDSDRKTYEGELSEADWNALGGILDRKEFRELKVPPSIAPLVMQDTHPYTISVARDGNFQNMEFLNGKSLKPYEPQIKPLLQWWKSFRGRRLPESNAPADKRCALDNSRAVISQ